MEDLDRLVTASDPLLTCCLCRHLLQEPVQLTCLHCCCQQCFSTAASTDNSQGVGCTICGTVTQAGREKLNGFIDSQVKRYKSIADSRVCGLCKGNGENDKPALLWCSACRHSLCGDCVAAHRQYFRQHVTLSLEELVSLDEVCKPTSPSASCAIHKKPLDIACVNCEEVVCTSCWAECKKKMHKIHVVVEEAFQKYVGKLVVNISTMENELLEKPESLLRKTKVARDRHLKELNQRKRRVVDAVETVYQQIEASTKNAYDDIIADEEGEAAVANRIASALWDARSYVRRLVDSNDKCAILNQQRVVQERLSTLSAELDSLNDHLSTTMREVTIDASLPEEFEDVIRSWIGLPVMSSESSPSSAPPQQQQQQQCLSFGQASVSIQLPVECWDVALTKDGRSLLLAALQHGLLEFSSSCGHELSRWRPPKYSSRRDDEVQAVAALHDSRAAVSLRYTRLVVLLRRCENVGSSSSSIAAAEGDTWTEQMCFGPLPWPADLLSTHGAVLAASQLNGPGTELQLLNLSGRRRLGNAVLQREYIIGSLAVAAAVLVTGSLGKLKLGGGRRAAHMLDAHSLAEGGSDKRLWRHVLSGSDDRVEEEELLNGICADSGGCCLYAAVSSSDRTSSRVCVLSLRDGSELRRFELTFSDSAAAARPYRLSLGDSIAAAAELQRQNSHSSSGSRGSSISSNRTDRVVLLAALDWNERLVTVHHGSMRSVGQPK